MLYNVSAKAYWVSTAALLFLSSSLLCSVDTLAAELQAKRQVQPGETLWRIASEIRPGDHVSVAQVMQALFELNPQAFQQQDINQLQHGHWLTLPAEEQIARQNATEAMQRAVQARAAIQYASSEAPEDSGNAVKLSENESTLVNEYQTAYVSSIEQPVAGNSSERTDLNSGQPDSSSERAPAPAAATSSPLSLQRSTEPETIPGFWSEIEWHSQLNLMQRWFPQRGLQQQAQWHSSVSLEMEWYWQSADRSHTVVVAPYVRWDQQDKERNLVDIAEAYWLYYGVGWELRAGIDKVFWGAVESQRLVDIINQRDLLESPDAESKLGQPMVQLSLIRDFGTVQAYLLPYFREREFAGVDGRLRLPQLVDTDSAGYESSHKRQHLDWALRWSQQFSGLDLGLSFFQGTSREPTLLPNPDGTLMPYYPQLNQLGLDGQWILGSWLWKMEAVYRDSQFENYKALTSGFEYTQIGINDRFWDLGWLVEYQYDSRGRAATAIGQNDLFVGWRLVLNDAEGSEILFGIIQDLDRGSSRTGYLEASTRLSDRFRLRVDGWFFNSDDPDDLVYWLRRDDFIQLTLEYYF